MPINNFHHRNALSDGDDQTSFDQGLFDPSIDNVATYVNPAVPAVSTVSSSGLTINLIWDSSVNSAPAAFKTAMIYAAQFLETMIANPITVNIQVGWNEVAGQSVGQHDSNFFFSQGALLSYSQLKAALLAHETSAADIEALNNLPAVDPTNGGTFQITTAQAKAWGILPANGSQIDGSVGFNSSFNFNFDPNNPTVGEVDFVGTAERELTHVLGRDLGLQNFQAGVYRVLDLFHYSAPGQLDLVDGTTSYFSIDGGNTNLANFDPTAFAGDWLSTLEADAFSANGYYNKPFTALDATAMEVVGFGPNVPMALSGIYEAVLQRAPTSAEATSQFTVEAASGTAAVIASVVDSPEAQFNVYPIVQIIQLATGNLPTAAQLAGWVPFIEQNGLLTGQAQANPLLDQMAEAFVASDNFAKVYNPPFTGTDVDPNSPVTAGEMQIIIKAATGIAATQTQVNVWVGLGLTIDQVFVDFALGDQYTAFSQAGNQQYLTSVADAAAGIQASASIVGSAAASSVAHAA